MVWPKSKIKLNKNLKKEVRASTIIPRLCLQTIQLASHGPQSTAHTPQTRWVCRDLCWGPETPGQTVSRCCTPMGISHLSEGVDTWESMVLGDDTGSVTCHLALHPGLSRQPRSALFLSVLCAGSLVKAF